MLSVSPSVCLSHAGILSTLLNMSSIFLLSGSPTILVYPYQILLQSFNGDRPNGGVECKGYEKNHDFRPIYRFISLASGRPADTIHDRYAGQQNLRGLAPPVSCWAPLACRSSHRTSTPAVGCLRQTRRATDSHSHSHCSQELCCFRCWNLEQFTSWAWTASVDTVHDHICTTPESASLRQPAERLILLKAVLF